MSEPEVSAPPATLDRLRVALKFSLWAWAFYWPGGGMLLLLGGLDPVSILVTFGSFTAFVVLLAAGGLSTTSSRTMRQFLMERPMYLVAALVLLILLAPLFAPAEHIGLLLFASIYLGALVFAGVRLAQHVRAQGNGFFAAKADQASIALGLAGLCALLVFLDAWVTILKGDPVSGPPTTVAMANWVNLLYPPMLLLATRSLREPLHWPRRRRAPTDAGSADGPAAIKA